MRHMRMLCAVVGVCVIGYAQENLDLSVIHRIKAEATKKSRVMEHLFQLTDVHGPRLTASSNQREAAEWSAAQFNLIPAVR